MVDKESTPGSITEAADSSRERISEISNVSRTISEMQQQVNQKVDETKKSMGDIEGIEDVQNSMNGVLSNLNRTIGTIGQGFAKVAASTAKASGDLVKGYGKAISEDISYNKQNIIAMAMARSTPLFGYFAAKFVETDVFQKAKERMKTSLGDALGSVTTKFKESFSSLLQKFKLKKGDKEVSSVTNKTGKVPKMQHGGYVEKGGLAKLHAAEVVMPIETVLEKVDASITVTRELAAITKKAQLNTLAKMGSFVADTREMQKVGIFKGFLRALKNTQTEYEQPAQLRMLRAVLSIQDSIGATIGTWPQVWQKMLVQHPTLRQLVFFTKTLAGALAAPAKWIYAVFKARGGYAGHLSRDKNPMVAAAINIGLVYSEGMWRLDNIAKFTRASAEATRDLSSAVTGKKYKPLAGVPAGMWSILGMGKKILGGASKILFRGVLTAFNHPEFAKRIVDSYEAATDRIYQKVVRLLPRSKEMHGIYGTGGTLEGKRIDKAFGIPLIQGAIPVSEIHVEQRFKEIEGYMKDGQKKETKLLGYNKHMDKVIEAEYKVTKRMDEREKRRTIWGFLGGIGGAAKSIIGGLGGVLSSVMGMFGGGAGGKGIMMSPAFWKVVLTGMGIATTSTIWDYIDKKNPKIADGTFFETSWLDMVRKAIPPMGLAFDLAGATKGAIWQAFKDKLRGEDIDFTKMVGGIVKDAVWKFLHIDEDLKKAKRWGSKIAGWAEGPLDTFGKAVGLKPKTLPEKFVEKIKEGKDKFMRLNPMAYLEIASDKLQQLRDKFMGTQKPFYGDTVQAAINYGYRQEKAFYKYVKNIIQKYIGEKDYAKWTKKTGKSLAEKTKGYYEAGMEHADPMSDKVKEYYKAGMKHAEPMSDKVKEYYEEGMKRIGPKGQVYYKIGKDKAGQLSEKVVGTVKTGNQIAKEGIKTATVGTEAIIKELKEGAKKTVSGWQQVGADMGAHFSTATNMMTTSINNSPQATNVIDAAQMYYSQYTDKVIKGDLDD
jgi:hypothetical protein